jgi:parvulin-like peptidyl-prolyl isomerase
MMLMNRRMHIGYFAVVLGLVIAVSSASGEDTSKAADTAALVNGTPISKRELDGEILKLQKTYLGLGKPLTCKQVTSFQSEVLDSFIQRELLYQEGKKSGIEADQAVVSKELESLRKQFFSDTDYKNELTRRGLTEEALRARIEDNLIIQQLVDRRFASKITIADNDMVAFYESRVELFKQPLQVAVGHILIQIDPKWDASRKQAAKKKADQILQDLKKGGDFRSLAREHSDGPTRTSGGDLGYIKKGQLDKQLEDVVFSMKTGELSELVETGYGYHIFKVTDRKPETVLPYDSVKAQIRQQLIQEKEKQEAEQYAKSLREKASVEILLNDDVVSAKQLREIRK